MGLESSSNTQDGEETYISIPRGGPIYLPDMVGPLSKTCEFETNVLQELEKLKIELFSDLDGMPIEDISVDELKIISDEELVNKAFEEAFKDDEEIDNSSKFSQKQPQFGRKDDCKISSYGHACLESSGMLEDASTSDKSLNVSSLRAGENGKSSRKISNKRKRSSTINQQNHTLNDNCIGKVEQLVKIRQRQDEDKAAARLHSFNGSCRTNVSASLTSDRSERMKALKSISSTTKVQSLNTREPVPVIHPEVVLCIEVYHNKRTWSKTQEFLVLGCQPLTELRDSICCLTDELMRKAGQHDPSGYFLIEEVFCNDLRDPSAINYSKPIFDWLRNSEDEAREKWECIISGEMQQRQKSLLGSERISRLPSFKAVEMHKVRFCDLQFRLGAGYLYCHQGDCKHAIVVRDMRLIHPEDAQNRAAYPITTFQSKLRFQKCTVCKIYKAEKVTVDDKWAPENPCYFCLNCYYMLHYVDGSLIYNNFTVFDYHHD
ncbi:snRNA-activating protein complex subunit [Diospyros lotus]|uniref:snRNA-activating protein complex subunit n=1 Tax=Diospyros lotus TaxID=55363 RepID=UPI00225B3D51|nr:snRNA-activating protein complex subunit [Diospyros lotus]XP_052170738.1 snRNA-activating protein complex subunit [Diospyros lotus]XP_052170739.1 snRNA-activating protein complex subunit [Diospyros lotus]